MSGECMLDSTRPSELFSDSLDGPKLSVWRTLGGKYVYIYIPAEKPSHFLMIAFLSRYNFSFLLTYPLRSSIPLSIIPIPLIFCPSKRFSSHPQSETNTMKFLNVFLSAALLASANAAVIEKRDDQGSAGAHIQNIEKRCGGMYSLNPRFIYKSISRWVQAILTWFTQTSEKWAACSSQKDCCPGTFCHLRLSDSGMPFGRCTLKK